VTPEKTVLSEELVSLTCPTSLGQITILSGHVPLVANLVHGELHARTEKDDHFIYVAGGFVEVKEGNKVVVLADAAEHHYDIDISQAEAAKIQAEKDMAEERFSSEQYAKVSTALQTSLSKLRVARKHAHRRNTVSGQSGYSE